MSPPSLPADSSCMAGSTQAPPLLVQLQQLSKEKQTMEAELERCRVAEREASERVRRYLPKQQHPYRKLHPDGGLS